MRVKNTIIFSIFVISILILVGCQTQTTKENKVCVSMAQAKEAGLIKSDANLGETGEVCVTVEQAKELGLIKGEKEPITEGEKATTTQIDLPTGEIIKEETIKTETKVDIKTDTKVEPIQTPTNELPTKKAKEGELISFKLKAYDPDGDELKYTFSTPLNQKGEWQTKVGDAGEYKVSITLSDGKTETKQDVLLIVEKLNSAPVMERIKDIIINEGDTIELNPKVIDPDGDKVTLKYSGWMTSAKYTTQFDDSGDHEVTITASDGVNNADQKVKIKVNDKNRAPVLNDFEDITVKEGDEVIITPIAIDQDRDVLKITYSKPFDQKGSWKTKDGDAGKYSVNITVSDGKLSDVKQLKIIVEKRNKAPVIEPINDITVNEGETIKLQPKITDADGDKVTVTYSGWMNSPIYQTTFEDAGEYIVTITATDGQQTSTQKVKIIVKDVNRAPVFEWS